MIDYLLINWTVHDEDGMLSDRDRVDFFFEDSLRKAIETAVERWPYDVRSEGDVHDKVNSAAFSMYKVVKVTTQLSAEEGL